MSNPVAETKELANLNAKIEHLKPGVSYTFNVGKATHPAGKHPNIGSSKITVNGEHFCDWFEAEFYSKPWNGLFPYKINRDAFNKIWNETEIVTGKKEVCTAEFVGHLMIMYNETGGKLIPIAEKGDAAYFFEERMVGTEPHRFKKASYNGKYHKSAGDQLKEWNVISSAADVAAWNSKTHYPAEQPASVKQRAMNCDFNKFRGRGLCQLTWRGNYENCVGKAVKDVSGKSLDDVSDAELTELFKNPKVYGAGFRNYAQGRSKGSVNLMQNPSPDFAPYGTDVAGSSTYGKNIFKPRCDAVFKLLWDTGYQAD